MKADREHEAAVAAFFKQMEKERPALFAAVSVAYPTLSNRQMRSRAETEMPVSQLHGAEAKHLGSESHVHARMKIMNFLYALWTLEDGDD